MKNTSDLLNLANAHYTVARDLEARACALNKMGQNLFEIADRLCEQNMKETATEPALEQSADSTSLTTVAGIECMGYQGRHPTNLDTDPVTLLPCPFCGKQAAYREGEQRGDSHPVAVECSNTSCGVKTPKHYADRVTAAWAWNRRAS